jgi:hypothetical protein
MRFKVQNLERSFEASLTVLEETDHARKVVLECNFISSKLIGVATKLPPKFFILIYSKKEFINNQ